MKYTFYEDPGHGWLEVPTLELVKLGIAGAISPCSYIHPSGKTVYLEEDCDLTTFLVAKLTDGPPPADWKEAMTRFHYIDKEAQAWFAANVTIDDSATTWPGRDTRCRGFPSYRPKEAA